MALAILGRGRNLNGKCYSEGAMTPLQWMLEEGDVPHFDVQASARILETDVATLQTWAARGITDFAGTRPGRSGKRLYSAQNLAILRAALLLVALGFKPSQAILAAGQAFMDALGFLVAGMKRGEEWKYSEIAGAVALIGASDDGAPNVRVAITGRHDISFADVFSGRPVVTFACGLVFEQIAERTQAWRTEDA
ncbi:HTH merR-type domain-containing protein [Methylorubrum populi]